MKKIITIGAIVALASLAVVGGAMLTANAGTLGGSVAVIGGIAKSIASVTPPASAPSSSKLGGSSPAPTPSKPSAAPSTPAPSKPVSPAAPTAPIPTPAPSKTTAPVTVQPTPAPVVVAPAPAPAPLVEQPALPLSSGVADALAREMSTVAGSLPYAAGHQCVTVRTGTVSDTSTFSGGSIGGVARVNVVAAGTQALGSIVLNKYAVTWYACMS